MFQRCRTLIEDYIDALRVRGMTTRGEHLLQEARARLRQVQWIHDRLLQLEKKLQEENLTDKISQKILRNVKTSATSAE